MWEISEGDPKFLDDVKLVAPKDLGSIVLPNTLQWTTLFTKVLNIKSVRI